jgi:hypothetical protein
MPPDLVGLLSSAPPSSITSGGSFAIDWAVANGGSATGSGFQATFYLSANSVFGDGDDIALPNPLSLAALGTSGVVTGNGRTISIPSSVAAGTYNFALVADRSPSFPSGQIAESNENNNAGSVYQITVTSPPPPPTSQPDLTAILTSAPPGSVVAGGSFSINYALANGGPASAGPFLSTFYISPNSTFGDSDDLAVDLVSVSGLPESGSTTGARAISVPGILGPGTYYIALVADQGGGFSSGQVAESNEGNNRSNVYSFTVTAPLPIATIAGSVTDATEDSGQPLIFNVNLDRIASQNITVSYQVQGSANASDYQSLPGSVIVAAGSSFAPISVYPINDGITEGDETLQIILTGISSGGQLGSILSVTGTIHDGATSPPAAPPTWSIIPSNTSANESVGTAQFTVTRSGSLPDQTVYVKTTNTEGFTNTGDYATQSGTPLHFAAGQANQPVTVAVFNDSIVEPNETFGLIIQEIATPDLNVFAAKSTFTILNDDTAGWSISPTSPTVNEAAGSVSFTITRPSGLPAQTVYVSTTEDQGSPDSGDFTGKLKEGVTFSNGQTQRTFGIQITNDSNVENNETFGVKVQQSFDDPVATYIASATFTIVSDDTVPTSAPPQSTASAIFAKFGEAGFLAMMAQAAYKLRSIGDEGHSSADGQQSYDAVYKDLVLGIIVG